jgi:TonB-dependent receptor
MMGDVSLARDLRLILGQRLEITRQTIAPFDQFESGARVKGAHLDSTDLLPAAAIVFSATEQTKLRASVTRTVARPQLRELAPYVYQEIVGGRDITGNPDLQLTKITNGDLRFEYFPTLREVLAFSTFVKHFEDPIEPEIRATGGANSLTYNNSPGANLIGVEIEARKSLEFLSQHLKALTLISNLTLAHSRIEVDKTRTLGTHASRPLVNQAPYVLNLALDYTGERGTNARLLYNVSGRRIVEVGTGGLDDIYEHPRHLVDFAVSQDFGKHFTLKLAGENLLNSEVLVTQGEQERSNNVRRRYQDGSTYTISAQYTY